MLDFIRSILTPTGHLLIQVPYVMRGAFDLVIADHIWHFSKKSLLALLHKANFKTVYIGNDVIEKRNHAAGHARHRQTIRRAPCR